MFGKKKKEEAKRLAEQQPLPVEPVEEENEFMDAEIIYDEEPVEETETISNDVQFDAEPATFASDGEEIDMDAVDDFTAFNHTVSIDPAVVSDVSPTYEIADADEDKPAVVEPVEEELVPEIPAEESSDEIAEDTAEDVAESPVEESENSEEVANEESEEENKEEVVYVVDGPEEDDEIVKPAKLVKLPHLIDYILNADPKPSKKVLLKYATMLAKVYSECKTPDDKAIAKSCVIKVANALRQ